MNIVIVIVVIIIIIIVVVIVIVILIIIITQACPSSSLKIVGRLPKPIFSPAFSFVNCQRMKES